LAPNCMVMLAVEITAEFLKGGRLRAKGRDCSGFRRARQP